MNWRRENKVLKDKASGCLYLKKKKKICGFRERIVEGEGTNAGTKNCLVTWELERKMQNEKENEGQQANDSRGMVRATCSWR